MSKKITKVYKGWLGKNRSVMEALPAFMQLYSSSPQELAFDTDMIFRTKPGPYECDQEALPVRRVKVTVTVEEIK